MEQNCRGEERRGRAGSELLNVSESAEQSKPATQSESNKMNAVLVFDPSNDLVFAKSNKLFRRKLVKFAARNGLLAASSSSSAASDFASTCSSHSSNSSASFKSGRNRERSQNLTPRARFGHRRHNSLASERANGRPSAAAASSGRTSDTSKSYLDVLMLLLTPYVASLRLTSNLSAYDQLNQQEQQAGAGKLTERASERHLEAGDTDLLDKFMSSVSLNHECNGAQCAMDSTSKESDEQDQFDHEFSARKFSPIQMPVECLKDCQIVYCELYDFIFIHMQQLELVSSFKMRLLQKRIDVFARLAFVLFGPSLNSMRVQQGDAEGAGRQEPKLVEQSQILRSVYQVWLDHQFEPNFLLEANERLIVSRHIEQLCQQVLQRLLLRLRSARGAPAASVLAGAANGDLNETHMHALLYSDTKLIASYSPRNSQPLNKDDLILLVLFLKAYNLQHDNRLPLSSSLAAAESENGLSLADHDERARSTNQDSLAASRGENPQYCYASNFNTNRQTYEISSTSSALTTTSNSAQTGERDLRRSNRCKQRASATRQRETARRLPSQFLVFLSGGGKFKDRLRVPHMLRLVPIARGITLLLLSEISTSYLCLQINRVLKILFQFNKQSPTIKLGQLARVTDSYCAIKAYFYGENYERLQSKGEEAPDYKQRASGSSRPERPSTSSLLGGLFRRYRNLEAPIDEDEQRPAVGGTQSLEDRRLGCVYESLGPDERRRCCQLVCRLEDLVSSNVHTYMRQKLSLPIDEHKREALLSSVCSALRESIDTFVIRPQLAKLNNLCGSYMRQSSAQMDELKLMARQELGDYLEYLAVKSACNVTMGAPIAHDLPALRSFIYVDRSRQELIVSPMRRSEQVMSKEALLEADFFSTIGAHMGATSPTNGCRSSDSSGQESSEGRISSTDSDNERRAQEGGSEFEDSDGSRSEQMEGREAGQRPQGGQGARRSKQGMARALGGLGGLAERRQSSASQRLYGGTSCDFLVDSNDRTRSSSGRSINTGSSSTTGEPLASSRSDTLPCLASISETQPHQQLVEENLMKGFTCFIYNRLASGQTSFSSNDGTYVYSYFLWFKRNSVRSLLQLKLKLKLPLKLTLPPPSRGQLDGPLKPTIALNPTVESTRLILWDRLEPAQLSRAIGRSLETSVRFAKD